MIKNKNQNAGERCSITPDIRKLLSIVVPALGHSQPSAFLDLLDNCHDADASIIKVQIFDDSKENIESYMVIDNGSGMDRRVLPESLRFDTDI